MDDKLRLGTEVRQLKIGQSFSNPKSSAFHSIKYDFKPASVDTNKIATVDVADNHQVTVTVPHLDGAGLPQTVFKGSQRPYQKECVLIIDRVTGEITLEKLACNIQVKKTRSESAKLALPQAGGPHRSASPSGQAPQVGQRISHKTKVTSGRSRPDRQITHLVPKHSPLHTSPSSSYPSPSNKSPKNHEVHNPSTLASLPMIGIDDFDAPASMAAPAALAATTTTTSSEKSPSMFPISDNEEPEENRVGEITDTSSSSSDSDSDTDPDNTTIVTKTNGYSNGGHSSSNNPQATHLLNDDLCLSEDDSD